jgi:hypothetical protein
LSCLIVDDILLIAREQAGLDVTEFVSHSHLLEV